MLTIPFEKHSSVVVCGSSASGKTTFVVECIKNISELYEPEFIPVSVHYFYGVYQPLFDELERVYGVECLPGAPTEEKLDEITQDGLTHCIILDDLMDTVNTNENLCKLFTEGCHHRKLCVYFITQNLFHGGKFSRTIARNTHYYCFTKSPRNASSVRTLAQQIYPGKTQMVMEAFHDTQETQSRGVFILDCHPESDSRFRLRTDIFNDPIVYIPL